MSQTASNLDPLPELPPVEAPTAGFIIQLFVIPALIVGVVIVVWLLFGKLAGGESNARTYVERLKGDSADWRSAYELANLIQNDSNLANDGELLGELTALLDQELTTDANPKFDQYLVQTLGWFQTLDAKPVGGKLVDPLATLSAALAPKQANLIRIGAAVSLAKQGARLDGKLDSDEAVVALTEASTTSEPEIRQVAIYALGFMDGEAAVTALKASLHDEDRYARYNAAIALGRKGDPTAVSVFREMLSPQLMGQAIKFETKSETDNKIEEIAIQGLEALQVSIKVGNPSLALLLRPDIEELTKAGLLSVRTRANELLKQLPAR